MNHAAHNKLVSFIWSIADDCLRDVYVRGKYRDVILPMVVPPCGGRKACVASAGWLAWPLTAAARTAHWIGRDASKASLNR